MLGGRALFAFEQLEVDADGEPTERAMLGAIMNAEFQSAMLSWMRANDKFMELWVNMQIAQGRLRKK